MVSLEKAHHADDAYGYRRLGLALKWSASKTRRLMKLADIVPLGVKRKKTTSKEDGETGTGVETETATENGAKLVAQIVPESRKNLLIERGLTATHFHHIWAEDFTHLWFQGKWYYLATIIDLYSRKIVGWALSDHHNTDLIESALLDAFSKSNLAPSILHRDQGSEYCSDRYDILVKSQSIEPSFSDKGHPWENGFQESFYRHFKIEIKAKKLDRFESLGELTEAIARQINYYNNERIHSVLKMTPRAFSVSGLPPRNSKRHEELQGKRKEKLKQKLAESKTNKTKRSPLLCYILTGVRDKVFGKVGA
jgi:transposase InsO family protein